MPPRATSRPAAPTRRLCAAAPCASLAVRLWRGGLDGDVIELAGGSTARRQLLGGLEGRHRASRPRARCPTSPSCARSSSGATVRGLKLRALRITGGSSTVFEGLDVDGRFAKQLTLEHSGGTRHRRPRLARRQRHRREGRDRRRSGFTFDNVVFHDVLVTDSAVHNECVYATGAEGLTVRNSRFYNCATMDLFFTELGAAARTTATSRSRTTSSSTR